MLLQDELLQEGQHINRLEMLFHSLNDFGNGHPIVDLAGEPRIIPRVPHIVRWSPPSDYLQSFLVSYQHGFPILGHLVLGSYPAHWFGVLFISLMTNLEVWLMVVPNSLLCRIMKDVGITVSQNHSFSSISCEFAPHISSISNSTSTLILVIGLIFWG